jgi:hypothetical protein
MAKKILTDEEIDNIIIAEKQRLTHTTIKGHPRQKGASKWREEPLLLRRQVIMRLLGQGKSRWTVVLELRDRWGVCDRTANEYVKDAFKFIADSYRNDNETLREVLMHKLEAIAEDAIASRDRKSAIKTYETMAKLGGLVDDKIRLEGETTVKFDFGDAK